MRSHRALFTIAWVMPVLRKLVSRTVLGWTLLSLPGCRDSPERVVPTRSARPVQAPATSPSGWPPVWTRVDEADWWSLEATNAGAHQTADSAPASPHPQANTEDCPEGMLRVTGEYCPVVIQTCKKYHDEYLSDRGSGTVSERCLEYVEPSRCFVDDKVALDFCIDRYEYPNQLGELPWVLTSWRQAQRLCQEQGKRLCTEDEYNFACEGPEMLPYVNGYVRDPEVCNIDKPYRRPDHSKQLLTYQACLEDTACKTELQRLDQRHAIGSSVSCVSWTGAVDLNGNVNEWVTRSDQKPPHRSGLKGGWWGPVRNRCRPTVEFHKEFDYGYEAGFRCCKALKREPADLRDEGAQPAGSATEPASQGVGEPATPPDSMQATQGASSAAPAIEAAAAGGAK